MEHVNQARRRSSTRRTDSRKWRYSARKLDTRKLIGIILVFFFVLGIISMISDAINNHEIDANATETTMEVETVSNNGINSVETEPLFEELDPNRYYTPIIDTTLTPNAFTAYDTYVYDICNSDKLLLAKVAYVEARGEDLKGIVAVVSVVLNRYVEGGVFDNSSIYSVISQRGQFGNIENVTQEMLDKVPKCMEAVELACRGWDPTRVIFVNGAHYFYNPDQIGTYQASIREGVKKYTLGNHVFHNDFNTP